MRSSSKGIAPLLVIFLLAAGLLAAAFWWHSTKRANERKNQQAAAAAQARTEAVAREAEQQHAFEAKLAAEAKKSDFVRSQEKLGEIYSRWRDAVRLADTTARIALSGPVSSLQSLKREAESLVVPDCLTPAREKLVQSMSTTIDGFMHFMSDPNVGKILASAKFDEGAELLKEYESSSRACTSAN